MRRDGDFSVVGWLLVLAATQIAAFISMWRVFVRTERGQSLDTIALTGNSIGQTRVEGVVSTVLDAMSVFSVVAATTVIVVIALVRGRVLLALAAGGLIAGANA